MNLLRRVALFAALAAVFAAAYAQAPLYYSNQNQYFLHGLARAGVGDLGDDWLANTADPTPAFTALVAATARHLRPWAFHLYYALLLGAYAAAMLGLFAAVAGDRAPRRWPAFLALFVAIHGALARWASYTWLGNDYPWFLQAGVAGQYVLGPALQPSAFGVLLVVSVCLFARGRPFAAALCAAAAATAHPTYLLPAGLLVLGFVAALLAQRRVGRAAAVGAVALAAVLPAAGHALLTFRPTSPEAFAAAQSILVHIRIPHHARPGLWLDPVAGLQLGWVVLGVCLARPRPLAWALAVPALLAALLTLAQAATGSDALALLFPWRVSAVLVPVATAVLLSRLVAALPSAVEGRAAWAASAAAVAACVAGGVWISAAGLGFHNSAEEEPLLDFVRRTRRPGDVYLLPVQMPQPVRGSRSSDFKPLAEKKGGPGVIPYDLQRFRLHTGAPIFVDFKSVPYKDTDVLKWHERLHLAKALHEQVGAGDGANAAAEMRARGVTHLVLPAGVKLLAPGAEKVHEDEAYQVYDLGARAE